MGDEKKGKPAASGVWSTIKPFVNGGASGMLATCVIQPIDMIKVTSSFHLSVLFFVSFPPNGLLGLFDFCCWIQICGFLCTIFVFVCCGVWWFWWCRWGFNLGKDQLRRSLPPCLRMRVLLPSIRFSHLFPCSFIMDPCFIDGMIFGVLMIPMWECEMLVVLLVFGMTRYCVSCLFHLF